MEGIRLSPAPHSKPSQCEPMCGATNPILGLRCTRPPHPAGTAHYQTNSTGVHAWTEHHRLELNQRRSHRGR